MFIIRSLSFVNKVFKIKSSRCSYRVSDDGQRCIRIRITKLLTRWRIYSRKCQFLRKALYKKSLSRSNLTYCTSTSLILFSSHSLAPNPGINRNKNILINNTYYNEMLTEQPLMINYHLLSVQKWLVPSRLTFCYNTEHSRSIEHVVNYFEWWHILLLKSLGSVVIISNWCADVCYMP